MKSLKTLLGAGLLAAGSFVCFWLYQRGKESSATINVRMEDPSTGTSTQPSKDNFFPSEYRELLEAQAALNEFPIAYRTLVRSTSLPDGSIDASGKTLPKEFISYLANENAGYDQFLAELSSEDASAFNILKRSFKTVGTAQLIDFAVKISLDEKLSVFDFIVYSSINSEIREYPTLINDAAHAIMVRYWNLLSKSPNPVFRLLAIEEANRVIKDKTAALALLDARTSEIDPVIVHALIDQLVVIGGEAAKASLTRISKNALARGDQAVSNAASDALAKLR